MMEDSYQHRTSVPVETTEYASDVESLLLSSDLGGKDFDGRKIAFNQRFSVVVRVAIAVVATLTASVLVFSGNERIAHEMNSPNESLKLSSDIEFSVLQDQLPNWNDFSIQSSNEYGTLDMAYPWLEKSNKNILFEAYKLMTISAHGVPTGIEAKFLWEFRDAKGRSIAVFKSEETTIQARFEETERKALIFKAVDSSDNVLFSSEYDIHTKYVKRELRTLTAEDREKFLDTAHTLWEVSTEDGRVKYGAQYTSIASFVQEHAIASNNVMCDQFHDGSGFFTHHMALQASFDAALKSVNPSVVLPYWDFTIEGQAITDLGESPEYFRKVTPFLSDTWFGDVDDNGHIKNSRWAHTLFPTAGAEGKVRLNSYGLIRAYWNNNNDPEVTRFLFNVAGTVAENKLIPNCKLHYDVLNTTSLGEFQMLSPAYGHGPMHVQIGGVTGGITKDYANFVEKWKSILKQEYSDGDLAQKGFTDDEIVLLREFDATYPLEGLMHYLYAGEFFHIYRGLWRSHICSRDDTPELLVCPESCSLDTPPEECRCSIPKLESGETTWENIVDCVLYTDLNKALFYKAYPQELIKDLVYMTSRTSVIEGEMVESASPVDIFFWLTHPALHRLEHAKRLTSINTMSGAPIKKWTVDEETWLDYSMYSFEAGDNKAFPDGNKCVGHGADDPVLPEALPLEPGFAYRIDTNHDGVVSNWEFYVGTNPNDPVKVDYVFDKIRWDHCTYDDVNEDLDII